MHLRTVSGNTTHNYPQISDPHVFGEANPPIPVEIFALIAWYVHPYDKLNASLVSSAWCIIFKHDPFWNAAGAQDMPDFFRRLRGISVSLGHLVGNGIYGLPFVENVHRLATTNAAHSEQVVLGDGPRLVKERRMVMLSPNGILAMLDNLINFEQARGMDLAKLRLLCTDNGVLALKYERITPEQAQATDLKKLKMLLTPYGLSLLGIATPEQLAELTPLRLNLILTAHGIAIIKEGYVNLKQVIAQDYFVLHDAFTVRSLELLRNGGKFGEDIVQTKCEVLLRSDSETLIEFGTLRDEVKGEKYLDKANNLCLPESDSYSLYFWLTKLVNVKKVANQSLTKHDYHDILIAVHKKISLSCHEKLKQEGFIADKYSSPTKAEKKVKALLVSLAQLSYMDPIGELTSYMTRKGLTEVIEFFSAVINPLEIGAAKAEQMVYLATGKGHQPQYILSNADGGFSAICLAAIKTKHLYLPKEAYPELARILVREWCAYRRIQLVDTPFIKHQSPDDIADALDLIDDEQVEALALLSDKDNEQWRPDLNLFNNNQIQRAYGTLQSDQDHGRDMNYLVGVLENTGGASEGPLALAGDIFHGKLTCNDHAMMRLMQMLPNTTKYLGNHDEPIAFASANCQFGKFRAYEDSGSVNELVKESFINFTWDEHTHKHTLISADGLTVCVTKSPKRGDGPVHLKFELGNGSVTVVYSKNEVDFSIHKGIAVVNKFIGNPKKISECQQRARDAIRKKLKQGFDRSENGVSTSRANIYKPALPSNDMIHNCNTLLGIRQICGQLQDFGLNDSGDILRVNSKAGKGGTTAPGLVFVASGPWS